jgi:hypothetical protein
VLGIAPLTPAAALGSGRRVKPAMTVRAERVMAVPHYAQGFGAEWARSRPLRAAFRAFMKQRLRPTERLSHILQIENETARGVAANKIVFHGQGLLCGANLGPLRQHVSIVLITSVVLRRGFRDRDREVAP